MVRSLKGDKAPFSDEYAPVAYRVIPEIPQFFRSNDDEFLKEQQQFVARQIFPKSLIEWVEDENWFCVDKDVIQRLMAFQGVSL